MKIRYLANEFSTVKRIIKGISGSFIIRLRQYIVHSFFINTTIIIMNVIMARISVVYIGQK